MSKYRALTILLIFFGSILIKFTWNYMSSNKTHNLGYQTINANLINTIKNIDFQSGRAIKLNSNGGRPSMSLSIAKIFEEKNIELIVDKECSSACAEVLLPSANKIIFKNSPVVGFHWGPHMNKYLLEKYAKYDLEECSWDNVRQLNDLYTRKLINKKFWLRTLDRLSLKSYDVQYKPQQCPWHIKTFQHEMWLPSSEQLRDLFGLKFSGDLCADNFQKCAAKVNNLWPSGKSIVIGDDVYISNGPS